MAVLSSGDITQVWLNQMRDFALKSETYGTMTKNDLWLAASGIDQYLEDNKTVINQSIPQPARGAMTIKQKAKLLVYVVEQRYITGN